VLEKSAAKSSIWENATGSRVRIKTTTYIVAQQKAPSVLLTGALEQRYRLSVR